MRRVKEGAVRKKEILVTARDLFVTKGYDQTSVNDILKVVGIAKGTFYYYFHSKEDVLEEIILEIVEEGARRAEKVLEDRSIPLVNRIMLAIMARRLNLKARKRSGRRSITWRTRNWNTCISGRCWNGWRLSWRDLSLKAWSRVSSACGIP